jgi:hypothetical protein
MKGNAMNEPRRSTSEAARDRRVALGWVAGQLRWESRLDGLRGTEPKKPKKKAPTSRKVSPA